MKILIFGGLGFIGTNVAELALKKGHTVLAVDNLLRRGAEQNLLVLEKHKNFKFVWGDIRNSTDFFFFKNFKAQFIINLAANPAVPTSIHNPIFDFDINAKGHLNVLEFAKKTNTPVILASSNKVFTDKLNTVKLRENSLRYTILEKKLQHGFDESSDVNGFEGFTNSPYGSSKLTAEKYSREYHAHYGLPIVVNRMSCIYGVYQSGLEEQGWVDWFLKAKKNNRPITIFGDGKQVRDLLFGGDVAELYIAQVENFDKVNGKTFNVGGGNKKGFHTSLLEIIQLIDAEFPGKKLRYDFKEWRESDQKYYVSNIGLIVKTLGWSPQTSIKEGLHKMWEQYN